MLAPSHVETALTSRQNEIRRFNTMVRVLPALSSAALAAAAMLAAPQLASASPCPSSNVIEEPPQFQWTFHPADANNPEPYYSGTMEVGEASFLIGGETLTTRAYRQEGTAYTIPGPTMSMVPGNKYVLSFHNTLPYEAPDPRHNVYKDANISNLHTHGLHISGESPGDDVTRSFEGGFGGDFVYDIPADHMGGTYWYHAHHHGSSFLQVSGGAFGLMVVDDQNDGIPANVAAMTERQIVLGYLDPAAAGTGGDTLMSGSLSSTWTINGNPSGNFCAPANEWQHWRVLLADRNAMEKDVEVGPNCEVALLARDGVWRTTAPKAIGSNTVNLTGASRADLAVRCSADSWIKVANNTVATIYADGAGDTTAHPYAADGVSTWSATRPDYLRDLTNVSSVNQESVSMGARTVNGTKYDNDVPNISLVPDQVQEWSLSGARRHPFHLHVYHMQAFGCGGDYEDGEYYDVISASCDVRFDLNAATTSTYAGRTIMHCHILEHEDQGAMGWLDVVGGIGAPTFPSDANRPVPFGEYYALGNPEPPTPPAAPSNLVAVAGGSSSINLSWTDNADNEDGFRIERSDDGVNFSQVGSVAPDSQSYTDGGLFPNATYDYRVEAYTSSLVSGYSNVATATTDDIVAGSSLSVRSVSVSTFGIGKGRKSGRAVVVVEDDQGNVVADAVVSGAFSGTFNETVENSDPTDTNGSVTMETAGSAKGGVSVTFCVTNVSHVSLTDFVGNVCASI